MKAHADKLCIGSYRRIDPLRQTYKTIRHSLNIFLQKSIHAARTEFAGSQIIFCNDIVFFYRSVRDHHNLCSDFKGSGRIIDYFADPLVDQCHRQFLTQNLFRPCTLIVTLIRMADRQSGRTHDHLSVIDLHFLKCDFKLSWTFQLIHRI